MECEKDTITTLKSPVKGTTTSDLRDRCKSSGKSNCEGAIAFRTRLGKRKRRVLSKPEPRKRNSKQVTKEALPCGICFDNIATRGVLDCCEHQFCYSCVKQWMKRSSTCPHCKADVTEITQVFMDGSKSVDKIERRLLKETIEREENANIGRVVLVGQFYQNRMISSQRLVQSDSRLVDFLVGMQNARNLSNRYPAAQYQTPDLLLQHNFHSSQSATSNNANGHPTQSLNNRMFRRQAYGDANQYNRLFANNMNRQLYDYIQRCDSPQARYASMLRFQRNYANHQTPQHFAAPYQTNSVYGSSSVGSARQSVHENSYGLVDSASSPICPALTHLQHFHPSSFFLQVATPGVPSVYPSSFM